MPQKSTCSRSKKGRNVAEDKAEGALVKKRSSAPRETNKEKLKREALMHSLYYQGLPTVSNDREVADRLNMFFDRCRRTGEPPTIEKMCLALGTYGVRVNEWEHNRNLQPGMSQKTTEMIRKAKYMIAAYDAELVVTGQMNTNAYSFRAKNFYGMKDQVEQVITSKDVEQTYEELEKRYGDVIDAEVSEVKPKKPQKGQKGT